jgi:hypothetical protein
MAKRKPIKNSSIIFADQPDTAQDHPVNPALSADVKKLIEFCSQYKGKFAEPIKINSYMTITNFDKFFNKQNIILQSWDETNIVSQSAITRLLLFKNFILNNKQNNNEQSK